MDMIVIIALALLLFSPFVSPVHAAERVSITIKDTSSPTGKDEGAGIPIEITLLEGTHSNASPSVGEKAEVIIENPREGDECITDPAPSDANGIVRATCYATKPGSVKVFGQSKDRGDSSDTKTMSFEDAVPTKEPTKKKTTTDPSNQLSPEQEAQYRQMMGMPPAQTAQAQPSSEADAIVNRPGLEKEDPNSQSGLGNGLAEMDGKPSVQGVSDQNLQSDPKEDLDLINSLIFLVAGLILLIGGLYFIWLQIQQHEMKKKQMQTTTVNPQHPEPPEAPIPPMPPMDHSGEKPMLDLPPKPESPKSRHLA